MKPDGPTMSTEEIWEAALKQRVVAQREHKERYRGQPGTPHTIRPERNVKPVQRTLGATKQQRAYWDETPVKPGSWRK